MKWENKAKMNLKVSLKEDERSQKEVICAKSVQRRGLIAVLGAACRGSEAHCFNKYLAELPPFLSGFL